MWIKQLTRQNNPLTSSGLSIAYWILQLSLRDSCWWIPFYRWGNRGTEVEPFAQGLRALGFGAGFEWTLCCLSWTLSNCTELPWWNPTLSVSWPRGEHSGVLKTRGCWEGALLSHDHASIWGFSSSPETPPRSILGQAKVAFERQRRMPGCARILLQWIRPPCSQFRPETALRSGYQLIVQSKDN